ncbi:cold-shock protein [Yersinia ruckeri]|uniref:Cold shock protein CspI n=1 Tax=Yersinia ruckeri TaxID=29486 RepID=A0A085U9W4_YERRU|nr:cold-shock protein [Yersinia ruckeri]AJI95188.1 RNA chaperone, negative regulator of cspA transcription [Yersinia ruckeri]AKA39838.1 cold-shock protein [Yersinia ruckeri]ARZ01459.1 cold shock-like protein CspE3 [Yersinia ruckeri]AUQ43443.1 cold-shock protein [Yersinia ruckeri]EEQ00818.1 Cold shock-like protein [Yersinia ruckeri ATCC 29473]
MMLKMGRVKWFNQLKGYGFISPLDGGLDVYVSKTAIANTKNKSLSEGQNVEFSTYKSIHGPSAADVIAF